MLYILFFNKGKKILSQLEATYSIDGTKYIIISNYGTDYQYFSSWTQ
jgi:hypothetical protein